MTSEEPLSPAKVSAHVFVLLILLFSGCVIEWAKQRYHPPFITNAMLALGELVIVVYMLGSLGKALRWTINEWRGKTTVVQGRKEDFWKQFIPRRVDIGFVFYGWRVTRWVIFIILAFIFILITSEIEMHLAFNDTRYRIPILANIPPEAWRGLIENFSTHSRYLIAGIATITAAVLCFFTTVLLKLRQNASTS